MLAKDHYYLSALYQTNDFYADISLKQQSAGRHVAPIGRIILNDSKANYSLLLLLNVVWLAEIQKIPISQSWFELAGTRIHDLTHFIYKTLRKTPKQKPKLNSGAPEVQSSQIIWFSYHLTMIVSGEGQARNASCAIHLISTFVQIHMLKLSTNQTIRAI